jgi:S-adenosyl-L-methionine hydrolase (adenosine-forming)
MNIITLTTDFGLCDSYVAQMKGVILGINPQVQIVDVTHAIPPQNVRRGAAVLEEIARVFPAGTIHIAVVDPGVGSNRGLLAVCAVGQRYLAPDNGLLWPVLHSFTPERIHRIEADRFWRKPVSATFHGRDILAPVAAHWSRGAEITEFGPPFDGARLVELPPNEPRRVGRMLVGQVESVDAFGNLITNIRDTDLAPGDRRAVSIAVGGARFTGMSRSYSDQPAASLLALIGNSDHLEVAINQGSAAVTLAVGPGAEVRVE